jgi:hypothetical protein
MVGGVAKPFEVPARPPAIVPVLGLTDVRAGAIPSMAFEPVVHLNYAEAVLPMKDGLPKLKDFPAEVGGSGEVMPE